MRLADRIIVLDHGRVAGTGPWEQLSCRGTLLSQLIQATAGPDDAARRA